MMGIQLSGIVEKKEIEMAELSGKRIAIDAYNWIYQFLSIIRQADGEPLMDSKSRVTSHLSGLFYRTLKLLETGIKPVYVFDGKPSEFKAVLAERSRVRKEAEEKWREAQKIGDLKSARKYAKRSASITSEIVEQSKGLLEAMGIPVVQAVSEGEAMCSYMAKKGDAWAAATQDYDALLFGCPKIIRNLSITDKKKQRGSYIVSNPEMIVLKDVLGALKITNDQLIILGILVGTDFNPGGVEGIGPKKALALVKQHKTLDKTIEHVKWDFELPVEDIFEFFKKPQIADYSIEFRHMDKDKIIKMLCDEFDFSQERIMSSLKKIKEHDKSQSSLTNWVKK